MGFPLSHACNKLLAQFLPPFDPPAPVLCSQCNSLVHIVWTQKKHCKVDDETQEPIWSQIGIYKRMCNACREANRSYYNGDHGPCLTGKELEIYKETYMLTMPLAAYTHKDRLGEHQPNEVKARYLPATPKSTRTRPPKRAPLHRVSPDSPTPSITPFPAESPRRLSWSSQTPRELASLAQLETTWSSSQSKHDACVTDRDILIGMLQVHRREVERCDDVRATAQDRLKEATLARQEAAVQLNAARKVAPTESSRAVTAAAADVLLEAEDAVYEAQEVFHACDVALQQAVSVLDETRSSVAAIQEQEAVLWRRTLFREGEYRVATDRLSPSSTSRPTPVGFQRAIAASLSHTPSKTPSYSSSSLSPSFSRVMLKDYSSSVVDSKDRNADVFDSAWIDSSADFRPISLLTDDKVTLTEAIIDLTASDGEI